MQTHGDVERILNVGAPNDITKFMGNLKFDIKPTMNSEQITELAQNLKLNGARMIAAASTHKGEDEIILDAFKQLKKEFCDIKLLLAPRHPERYEKVEQHIAQTGFAYGKRSNNDTFENNDIILL